MWIHSTMTNSPNANMLAEYKSQGKSTNKKEREREGKGETLYRDVLGVNLPCVRGF